MPGNNFHSIADFEQLNAGWEVTELNLKHVNPVNP